MNKLKKSAGLLNESAPKDHFLAYITADEKDMLVQAGGKETPTASGIKAYPPPVSSPEDSRAYHTPSNQDGGGSPNIGSSLHGGATVKETFKKMKEQELPKGHPEWQEKEAKKTIKPTDTLTTTFHTTGRPDITYSAPDNTTMGDYASRYELNQIKHIQDQKLKTVKNKLRKAGFDIPKDATFAETKAFINDLSSDDLPDRWQDLKDNKGNPLYSRDTRLKWEAEGYIPETGSMKLPGFVGGFLSGTDKPLTRDELWMDLDLATEVGKSTDMDWQERMKTYSPKQYESLTGTVYDPHTKTYTSRDKMGGGADDRLSRVAAPYTIGGTPAPQQSQVANYFANLNNTNLGINQNYLNTYNTAKTNMANTLSLTPNTQQYGYGNTFNDNYARSMTSANPFFEELTDQGLI